MEMDVRGPKDSTSNPVGMTRKGQRKPRCEDRGNDTTRKEIDQPPTLDQKSREEKKKKEVQEGVHGGVHRRQHVGRWGLKAN